MSTYGYSTILSKAKTVKQKAEKEYKKTGALDSYYIAKSVLNPKKDIKKISFKNAPKSTGNDFGRQIKKSEYTDMAKRFVKFVESKGQLPNNIRIGDKLMRVSDYTLMFANVLISYDKNGKMPDKVNVNSKVYVKPIESTDVVYAAFVKKFGKITCIDDALEKIAGRGYGYYYDDQKSNMETINAIASSSHNDDPNCTDSTQMLKHVADGTKKYKKVDCVHVRCRGGDGHVFLKITQKDGSVFYRDPAAALDSGDPTKVWCRDGTVLAINPSWWLANLNR